MNAYKELRVADVEVNNKSNLILDGYQLTGAQLFIKNLFNPNTLYKRILINWQTGVGKSIAAITIGNEFIKQFQERYVLGEKKARMVCILGFNTGETIQADLLKFPELGYVTKEEVKELNTLILNDDPKQVQYSAMLHRRLSEKSSGGYYKFYGYREFVNNLFIITEKGINSKFSIQNLFNTNDEDDQISIQKLISEGLIKLNNDLLAFISNGLIIADEIHNVYNSLESNNYGLAIQYVLDYLKDDAPRAIFMSATPLTGNASEIIDLLNLLNQGIKLNRSDYFYKDSEGIYQLKPETINEIIVLTKGKVSYLLDTDINLYPERIFIGSSIQDIPYLKINVCNIPEYYANAIEKEKEITQNISTQSYTLYDMVFPNPASDDYGLYSDVINTIQKAPTEWKRNNNIDLYIEEGASIITGNFLYKDNLQKYSMKYYNVLMDILKLIYDKKPGKIMIYHHRVQVSGVLLLQEIFKINGFIDDVSEPNNSTLCVVCGVKLLDHDNKDHTFKPCRFIMAHSKMNRVTMKRNIIKFNDINNLYGTEFKLIIGSRIIREGLNFKAIRYQYILSLPINFPILIQVLGRVVRKNSHIDLPKDQQNVYIKIFANEIELPRYKLKAKEYLVIQEVERAIRINAVDNFINYKKIATDIDTLESLKFRPTNIEKPSIISKYFDAYNYNSEEILLINRLLTLLFNTRSVWIYDDLWNSMKQIGNVNYNMDLIDKGNFDIALHSMNIHNVNNEYYIKSTDLDIESFFRKKIVNPVISLNLNEVYSRSINKIFNIIMETYNNYINTTIELSLVDLPEDFHVELLTRIITKRDKKNITNDDTKVINLYNRFKIAILQSNKIIGYVSKIAVNIYNFEESEWKHFPHDTYSIGKRFNENEYIIGYVSNDTDITAKLKMREPVAGAKYSDMRSIKKGMVCETYVREDLLELISNFRKINKDDKNYASKYDNSIHGKLSISDMCKIIKLYFLHFEEKNRSTINGMKDSIRWLYLFNDRMPNIAIKK